MWGGSAGVSRMNLAKKTVSLTAPVSDTLGQLLHSQSQESINVLWLWSTYLFQQVVSRSLLRPIIHQQHTTLMSPGRSIVHLSMRAYHRVSRTVCVCVCV